MFRNDKEKAIDADVNTFLGDQPELSAVKAPTEPTEEERVVLDLQNIWPIVKSVFSFIRPFLVFKPKWKVIIDRFIAGIDVIIPEHEA